MPLLFPMGDFVRPIPSFDGLGSKPVDSIVGEIIIEIEPLEVLINVEPDDSCVGVCQ